MTRKDYVAIAELMRDERESAELSTDGYRVWADIEISLADVFETDNPRFDRTRFYRACEGGE